MQDKFVDLHKQKDLPFLIHIYYRLQLKDWHYSKFVKLLSQVSSNEFRQNVCIGEQDGVIHASIPPCAEGEQLVDAELSGLAVLAAQVKDPE